MVHFFALLAPPPLLLKTPNNQNFEKMKKSWRYHRFTRVPKTTIIGGTVPEIRRCYPPNNPKNQNFQKMKKTSGDVIILQIYTKNHDMMYASRDMECDRQFFLILGGFLPFYPRHQKLKFGKSTWRYYPFSIVYHK